MWKTNAALFTDRPIYRFQLNESTSLNENTMTLRLSESKIYFDYVSHQDLWFIMKKTGLIPSASTCGRLDQQNLPRP